MEGITCVLWDWSRCKMTCMVNGWRGGSPRYKNTEINEFVGKYVTQKFNGLLPFSLSKLQSWGYTPLADTPKYQILSDFDYLCMYEYIYIYLYTQFKSHYYVVFWMSSISTLAAHDKRVVSVKKVSLTSNGDWWEDYQRMVVWDLANNYGFQW